MRLVCSFRSTWKTAGCITSKLSDEYIELWLFSVRKSTPVPLFGLIITHRTRRCPS
jgi:hypothetical protein